MKKWASPPAYLSHCLYKPWIPAFINIYHLKLPLFLKPISNSDNPAAVDQLLMSILWKRIWSVHEYFLKWIWNSSFLTSITSSLTPISWIQMKVEATTSKQLFTTRSLHVWGRSFLQRFTRSHFVSELLIGREIGWTYYTANQ